MKQSTTAPAGDSIQSEAALRVWRVPGSWTWWLLASTIILTSAAKVALSSDAAGPVLFSDELIFSHFSWQLRDLDYAPVPSIQFGATYVPPLYPLVLLPATFIPSWYAASLLVNAVVSSLVVIPVYLLGVRYVSRTTAVVVAMIAATYPAHWIYSSLLMSENLFLVLFFVLLLAASEYFRSPSTVRLALVGVALGLAFLTRHIALAMLPVALGLIAYVELSGSSERVHRKLPSFLGAARLLVGRSAVFAGAFVLTISPWIAYGLRAGDLAGVLGLRSSPVRGDPPLTNLGPWLLYYTAYLVVISAPHVFATVAAVSSTTPVLNSGRRTRPLVLTAVLGSVGLLVPAMRHSFRVYEDFGKLHGRYITYLFIVAILLSLAFVEHRRHWEPHTGRRWVRGLFAAAASVFVASASAALLNDQQFMTMTNSPEGYGMVAVLGPWWVGAIAGGGVATALAAMRWRPMDPRLVARWLAVFVLGTTAVTSIMLVREDPLQASRDRASHARALADVARSDDMDPAVIVLDTEGGMTNKKVERLEEGLQFWRVDEAWRVIPLADVPTSAEMQDLPPGSLVASPRDLPFDVVSAYEFRGKLWRVFQPDG